MRQGFRQISLRLARSVPWSVWLLAILCTLPELVLLGADWGVWGSARWRPLAYTQGAFWAGLLYGWTPNFALQPVTMFVGYAWLHVGALHVVGNLLALLWLGPPIVVRRGNGGLIGLWLVAMVGGGAAFGLLTTSAAPMVGASGALFGLAADWLLAEVREAPRLGPQVLRGAGMIAALLALNALVWAMQGGQLAWETHLGGFLAGLVLALAWRGRG